MPTELRKTKQIFQKANVKKEEHVKCINLF